MHLNECGIYIDPKKLHIPFKNNSWQGIDIKYGEAKNKWGYSIDVNYSKGGYGHGLHKDLLIYDSKKECLKSAFKECYRAIVEYFKSDKKMLDFINNYDFSENEYQQLELF